MEFNYQDRGNYFRGLLILIGKDNIINQSEKNKIIEIGNKLGFESNFCEEAVSDFLSNKYVSTLPPKFSNESISKSFLNEAINLSLIDNDFHTEELEWLQSVAQKNDICNEWLDTQIKRHVTNYIPKELVNLKQE